MATAFKYAQVKRLAPFFEADPLGGVSGLSLAKYGPKTAETKIICFSIGYMPLRPPLIWSSDCCRWAFGRFRRPCWVPRGLLNRGAGCRGSILLMLGPSMRIRRRRIRPQRRLRLGWPCLRRCRPDRSRFVRIMHPRIDPLAARPIVTEAARSPRFVPLRGVGVRCTTTSLRSTS